MTGDGGIEDQMWSYLQPVFGSLPAGQTNKSCCHFFNILKAHMKNTNPCNGTPYWSQLTPYLVMGAENPNCCAEWSNLQPMFGSLPAGETNKSCCHYFGILKAHMKNTNLCNGTP
jgi:hypothetical protein